MASTPHTVENACRVVRADLDARQEDARTLRERCERAFAYCDDREHRADAEALEVWCGAVGVTLDSTLAAKARIAPILHTSRPTPEKAKELKLQNPSQLLLAAARPIGRPREV